MRIIDIEMQPSTGSVIAHLQDRLRDAWVKDQNRREVHDLLDAIGVCLRADGYPILRWDEFGNDWVPDNPQPPLNYLPKRF